MRTTLLILLLITGLDADAQNWALLNPAYKYNYSNDGTDTISNQVFVTHIDTLGPDSFRYELNRIAVVCDTCPASMGGPCDGCFVRTDQPQFLGFSAIKTGEDYYLLGPDTFMIKSTSSPGTSWVFNSSSGVTATVDADWEESFFNTNDSLRRILLSNGDTLLLSRSFGVQRFRQGNVRSDLLGVEGAGVGRLYPSPLEFFDYQPGDVLVYKVTCTYWCSPWPQGPITDTHFWTAGVTARSTTTDTVTYTTSVARTYPHQPSDCPDLEYAPHWPMPLQHWQFALSGILANHPILTSYPGQVMDTSLAWIFTEWFQPRYVASYGIAPDGRAIIRARHLGESFGPTSHFNLPDEIAPDLFPFSEEGLVNVWYEEGLGLRKVEFYLLPGSFGIGVELVGAVIGGDTIIQSPAIDWEVATPEEARNGLSVRPNPAMNTLTLDSPSSRNTHWYIMDASGKQAVAGQLLGQPSAVIDVSALAEGLHVLVLVTEEGPYVQRFVIAR